MTTEQRLKILARLILKLRAQLATLQAAVQSQGQRGYQAQLEAVEEQLVQAEAVLTLGALEAHPALEDILKILAP